MSGEPYSKERQLARGPRKYRRRIASAKQWQALDAEKRRSCRICFRSARYCDLHHLVPKGTPWFGDDVAENLVSLCPDCHRGVHLREPAHCRLLLTRLDDDEYVYAVERAGEGFAERIYGLEYER